ncbi:MAG: STAS domain-containing protein [Oscillospiraceae bacterium]
MDIKKTKEGGTLTIALIGRLNTTTAPQLEVELQQSTDGVEELIFDFSQLEYISSAGLRLVMVADKVMQKQGRMKIIHPNEEILEVFEVTGLIDLLQIL